MAKAKVVIKLNREGVRQLLRSQEMQDICKQEAQAIANTCGDGYDMDVYTGKNRCNAMVWADTWEAKRDNFENNTLIKAIGGGK